MFADSLLKIDLYRPSLSEIIHDGVKIEQSCDNTINGETTKFVTFFVVLFFPDELLYQKP